MSLAVSRRLCISLAGALALAMPLAADEGMWTFHDPPPKKLQETYGFTPTPAWLDRVRLASVRFNDGGSGSFVSPDGLMITNHHVGLGCIQNLSSAEHNYVSDGFLAESWEKEAACPGYEVNVLMATEDVTSKVLGATTAIMSDKEAREARKAAMAGIENECNARTGLRCNVVKMYGGAEYQLYSYKKYTDVRLVFAPEQGIAFFGGDPDNFTFPRHDLDFAFFRAYENGKPVKPVAYLPWSTRGADDGDLVFVSGNPGSTSRLETMAQLEGERDVKLPEALAYLKRRLALLQAFAARSPENARRVKATIFSHENSQKAFTGRLEALQDQNALAAKKAREKELRDLITKDPTLARTVGDAFEVTAAAQKKDDAKVHEARYVVFGGSRLLPLAAQIVRHGVETKKPNEVRLEEYIDSNLASLENRLYSKAPIYDDVEELTLTDHFQAAQETLGKDHAYVKAVLAGKTPAETAREAVRGTTLKDVEARKALVKGGAAAVEASTDSMIALARRIDPLARALRKFREDEIDAVTVRAGERISQARFKAYGKTMPPDATFTLRLSYGTVKGHPAEGTMVPARTTFHGLYDRSASFGNRPPWNLPRRYEEKKSALELATPLNFVCTADIIGGNSGSPTINRDGEFVGIIFDGNIHSLALDYFYTEEKARAVSVDARGILEVLRKVYAAKGLVSELVRE